MTSNEKYQKFLSIDLTKRCTNNCKFCVVEGGGKSKEQNLDDIKSFLEVYKKKGFTSVNLHGGEPTFFRKFKDLILLINDLGYEDITIQTNGYGLADKNLVTFLLEKRVKLFVISFHDCDLENHNLLTGNQKSFELADKGIKNVIAQGGMVRTNTVLVKSNYKRIKDIIDYLYSLKVKKYNISSLNTYWIWKSNQISLFEELTPTYREMEQYLKKMLDYYEEKDVVFTMEGFPFCYLQGYEKYNLSNTDRDITLLSDDDLQIYNYEEFLNTAGVRVKRKDCEKCSQNKVCKGVWQGYVVYKGWNEFNPVLV